MFTFQSTSVRRSIYHSCALLLGAALLFVAGCDFSGNETITESDYEVTNDLGDRVTESSSASSTDGSVTVGKATNVSFNLSARIQPPTLGETGARATSLSFDGNDNLYIGYLLLGDPFGGGIDILNAADPTNLSGATSLKSANTDVQDLTSPPDDNVMYVAEASLPKESGTTPSRISVLQLADGTVSSTSRRLSAHVAKGVAVEPTDNGTSHDFHVITDNNSLYRFDNNLTESTMRRQTVGSDVSFSGITTTQNNVFTLSVDGQIYSSDWGSSSALQANGATLDSGIELLGIGRLSAADQGDAASLQGDRLFAALGAKGFAVLNDNGSDVLFRETDTGAPGEDGESGYYTSVTLHGNVPATGGDLVYGARRYGIVDVYEVSSDGISNGLNLIRRLYLREAFDLGLEEGDDVPPSVNYVLGVRGSNTLYVSGGKAGTLVLNLGAAENPKAISFAAFCSTQGAQQDDVSFDVTQTNDEGESVEISWTSDTELSTVVLKAGNAMYNFDGGTSGNALSGAGDVPGSSQTPPRPCPADETLVFKDETV